MNSPETEKVSWFTAFKIYIENTQAINISETSDVHKNKFEEAARKTRSNTNFSMK